MRRTYYDSDRGETTDSRGSQNFNTGKARHAASALKDTLLRRLSLCHQRGDCSFFVQLRLGARADAAVPGSIWFHSHGPSLQPLQKRLPPDVTLETNQSGHVLGIAVREITREIADKCEIHLDQRTLRRRLYRNRAKEVPLLDEAMYVVNALRKMKGEDRRVYFAMKLSEVGCLQHIAFALSERRFDYLLDGAVPGVSLDAKVVATVYRTPLALMHGRDNKGKIVFFFMGFVQDERKEKLYMVLTIIYRGTRQGTKFLVCDQAQAICGCVNGGSS